MPVIREHLRAMRLLPFPAAVMSLTLDTATALGYSRASAGARGPVPVVHDGPIVNLSEAGAGRADQTRSGPDVGKEGYKWQSWWWVRPLA